ncbi:MAG: phosphatidate cytidylyltransferase [Pseudomonadota bacterium]
MVDAPTASPQRNELALRLVSAAVLIPFGLYVVWSGGVYLAAGCALFAALMAYEWVRMSASPLMNVMVPLAIIPPLVAGIIGAPAGAVALIACALSAGGLHPLARERLMSGFAILYTSGMPLALFALRDGPWDGAAAALIFMAIVWASDSAAYFAGRGFGGPSLSSDSPSKTWSGAVGAILCSVLCGVIAARITGGDVLAWALTGGLISAGAQWGDLFESSLKRRFGVKDASGLVPGHGGVLDRVDGLGMVCVMTALIFYASPFVVGILGLAL